MTTTQKWNGFGAAPEAPQPLNTPAQQLVAAGVAKGWLSIRPQTPEEIAFVRRKLGNQSRAEDCNEKLGRAVDRDPEAHARKLDYMRRYNRLLNGTAGKMPPLHGSSWRDVLFVAESRPQFTADDLCPPLEPATARQRLRKFVAAGLLVRVGAKKQLKGRGAAWAVYSLRRCKRCGRPCAHDVCFDCLAQENNGEALLEAMVCEQFAVTKEEVHGRALTQRVALGRHALVYCLREIHGWSFPRLGRYLGRCHATAIYSYEYIRQRPELIEQLLPILQKLSRGTTAPTPAEDGGQKTEVGGGGAAAA